MKTESNIEALQRVKKTNGKVKGSCTLAIFEYLRLRTEPAKIEAIKKRINDYGYNTNPEEISPFTMHPIDFELAILFSLQDVLKWREEEIKELGRNIPKLSFLVKFFVNYLISLRKGYEKSYLYWQAHFNFGKLEVPELNEKEKYLVLFIKEFDIHPLYCAFLSGYFETMSRFILGKQKNIFCKEEECVFSGASHHRFIIRWE